MFRIYLLLSPAFPVQESRDTMRFPGNDHPATLSKIVDEFGKVITVWENSSLEKNRNTGEIEKNNENN